MPAGPRTLDHPAAMDPTLHGYPRISGPITDDEFLIIAGAYRAGTTSLFTYLADHPEVRPAVPKEPGFFFSFTWAHTPSSFPPGREVDAYLSRFKRKEAGRVRLDATPNYLYDIGCAQRIATALPDARVVLILREPISRLVSWFRHSLFQGRLAPGTDFERWVRAQLVDERPDHEVGYLERSVRHGRYSSYVSEYLETFGQERVHVIWFDDLVAQPRRTLQDLSAVAGLSPSFYDAYDFRPENESSQFRYRRAYFAYLRTAKALLRLFAWAPNVRFKLEPYVYRWEPKLLKATIQPAAPVVLTNELHADLARYYAADVARLQALTGPVPWASAVRP